MSITRDTTKRNNKEEVLFSIAFTKELLEQFVIALILINHSSVRGVVELLRDIFDFPISVGTVDNIIKRAAAQAETIQKSEDLSDIKGAALDEIYQGGKPVLAATCVRSSFIFLLSIQGCRDATTWAILILDVLTKGLMLEFTIADRAKGIQAGLNMVLPNIPRFADVFHALHDFGKVVIYYENQALGLLNEYYNVQKKLTRSKNKDEMRELVKKIEEARIKAERVMHIADSLSSLRKWFQKDILCRVGPELEIRSKSFDFIMEELKKLESPDYSHIKKIRCKLENQRNNLLMFVEKSDQTLQAIAKKYKCSPLIVRQVYELQAISHSSPLYWDGEKKLREKLQDRYYSILQEVITLIKSTVRASSVIENVNSRLRNYFFLRKSFGQSSLDLLRFYLNHKRFMRSEHPEHVGKSPAEILSGKPGIHWLEMLGYTLFKQAVA